MRTCCFTGGRPTRFSWKYDESDLDCKRLKEKIYSEIADLISAGCTNFISGMAQGADTYCAEAVLKLKESNSSVKLECALPCPEQSQGWTELQKLRYEGIIAEADKVTYVSKTYSPRCMLKRNAYMVDNSDVVLAIWNGSPTGGTYNTINYARKNDKTLKIIRY